MESRHKVQDKLNLKRGLKSKKGKNTDRGFLFFMFWESWTGTKYILYSVPLQTQHFVMIVLHYSCFKSCIVSRLDASSNFLGWSKIHARVIQQFETMHLKFQSDYSNLTAIRALHIPDKYSVSNLNVSKIKSTNI